MLNIIIPTLNEEDYLPKLLDSITKQNFKDYEIIVADAGSQDKTIEIARVSGCKISPGGLPAKGRNEGAKTAEGDLLLFLDADMILPPKFLENILKEFKNQNLDVASFPISAQENKFDELAYKAYNYWTKLTQNFLPHATQAILVKKKTHQAVNGFDEDIKLAEDHYYVREINKFAKFRFLKIGPVLTSSRRFEQDGRIKTCLKYILAELYMIFRGPIRSDIFEYKFNHYKKKKK